MAMRFRQFFRWFPECGLLIGFRESISGVDTPLRCVLLLGFQTRRYN
jgi:hypothetical protein